MDQDKLLHMANQIGAFFDAMPDPEQAAHGVADHIRRTWEPRMIAALQARIDALGFEGASDIVRRAWLELDRTAKKA